MADTNLVELFTDIADAIREKEESEDEISALDFPQRILDLVGGGGINFSYEEYTPSTTVTLGSDGGQTFYHYFGSKANIFMILSPYDAWAENETDASYGYGLETLIFVPTLKSKTFYTMSRRQLNSAIRSSNFQLSTTSFISTDEYTKISSGVYQSKFIEGVTYRIIQIGGIFSGAETIEEE